MITQEQIVEVLLNHGTKESISKVEVQSNGAVRACLENWVNPDRPYRLIVHAIEKRYVLHIHVFGLLKPGANSDIFHKLLLLNLGLGCGHLCFEPYKGQLFFNISHLCENIDNSPSLEFLRLLLNKCVRYIRFIERIVLFETMVEKGIPKERAEQFVKSVFGDDRKAILVDWDLMVMKNQMIKNDLRD